MAILKLWGPPGTGKTYRAMAEARRFLAEGGQPSRLGFCALTVAAANEAKARLADQFGLGRDELPWVGTIHSLSLRMLGASPDKNVKADDRPLRPFFSSLGLDYDETGDDGEDVDMGGSATEGNFCLGYWDWHRANLLDAGETSLERHLDGYPGDLPRGDRYDALALLRRFIPAYEAWKRETGRWDFTGLLLQALVAARKDGTRPSVSLLIVDEAQDLGRLLWAVVDEWSVGVPQVVLAGDPNQAIYGFLGAEPGRFIQHLGTWEYLSQSYRVTTDLVELAKRTLADGGGAVDFPWTGLGAREQRGDGRSAFLARTKRIVAEKAFELADQGVPFRGLRGPDPLGKRAARDVATLLDLGSLGAAPVGDLVSAISWIPSVPRDRWLRYGAKAQLARAGTSAVRFSDLESLGFQEGLLELLRAGRPWDALGGMKRWDLGYYRRVVERHGARALTARPGLELTTIHRAKGHEWDEIEVSLNWGKRPYRSLAEGDRAAEYRVAYVALTRTRGWPRLVDSGSGQAFPIRGAA